MPFHIFRLFFPISPQKSCMTNAMQQGKPFQHITIAVGRLQSYPPGLPAGRGVFRLRKTFLTRANGREALQRRPVSECNPR